MDWGPEKQIGMPGPGGENIEGFKGVYLLEKGEGQTCSVNVYFSDETPISLEGWNLYKISGFNNVYSASPLLFFYNSNGKWSLFIEFEKEEDVEDVFIEKIITQMVFFVKEASDFMDSSFPAVLQF